MASDDDELFDDVLNLEERYYREGYDLGYRDGAEAGRVEGRSVGLKQGYEKFLEAGRLQGRAIVWANRIPALRAPPPPPSPSGRPGEPISSTSTAASHIQPALDTAAGAESSSSSRTAQRLPDLGAGAGSARTRLEKNVALLYGMLEPGTLSTRNDDDAVNDFDSRVKGARGKFKVVERVVGEAVDGADANADGARGRPAGS